eukprot:TRINITY_DN13923_c0_g1_i1.p1 TRINITY_DN13923_c0_g1~~TRINITY_DN13923_c0_g1_i1.p1  ORF type:complete len:564 (+),score=193.43 TRINITY_DN13923_c0_g1_i1:1263-2954(+)
MEDWLEKELPPVPTHQMTYTEWKDYNNEREKVKCLMELKKDRFLDENGDPVVPASEGRLEITVVSATGFQIDDNGTCDPYVQLALGPQMYETAVKRKTVSPVWDEKFEFLEVGHQSGVLSIGVWDKNLMTDVCLGNCQLKLTSVVRDVPHLLELPLVGKRAGDATIALRVKGIGPAWPNERQQHLLKRVHDTFEEKKMAAMKQPMDTRIGTLEVLLQYGAGLRVCDMRTSDPYCLISISNHPSSNSPKTSTVKESTLKPVWNETFVFTSVACKMNLFIKVMDKDRVGNDDDMGSGSVPLVDLFDGVDEEKEIPLRYNGKNYGIIAVKLRATGFGRTLPKHDLRALGTPHKETITREASPSVSPPSMSPPRTGESAFMQRMEATRPPAMRRASEAEQHLPPAQTQGPAPVLAPAPVQAPPPAAAASPQKAASPIKRGFEAGKLSVTVLSARNLPVSADSSCLIKVLLKSPDIGQKKFKTRPVNAGTANPEWNVMFTFDSLPKGTLASGQLQVEVWDPVRSEVLAAGLTSLGSLKDNISCDSWLDVYDNESPAGSVRVILTPQGI